MQTYLVGGAVRDKLLGRKVKEYDYVVVGATVEQMKTLGFTQVGKDFPVFLHPKTKDEHALARTERKQGQGYTGFICDFTPDITLEQDLARRDLTVNAIAEDAEGQLIDPYHGQKDLEQRILRHVSPAFSEDPLRVLRVARFRARYHELGFTIADETLTLMREIAASGELASLTPERVWLEWHKALEDGYIDCFVDVLYEAHALTELCPALATRWPEQHAWLTPRIEYARQQSLAATAHFALLMCDLSHDEREAFFQHFRVPNQFIHSAQLLAQHHQTLAQYDAEILLELFNAIDLWRRPEHLNQLLISYDAYTLGQFDTQHQIRQAAHHAQQVSAQTYIQQGISGAAIKTALQQGRLAAIAQALVTT